jgi:cellulose biosynthesis protein BcsQ
MSVPIIAFFNNKGGVGKTSLVYHVSSMLADLDYRVVAADMDPQGNLSAAFLSQDKIEVLAAQEKFYTIRNSIDPILHGTGALRPTELISVSDNLSLLPANIYVADVEDALSDAWLKCLDRNEHAIRITGAISLAIHGAVRSYDADVVLIDMGPNIGSLNRAVLLAATSVVIPVAADLYSIQGLRVIGNKIREWSSEWRERLEMLSQDEFPLESAKMTPIGYVVTHHVGFMNRPIRAEYQWLSRIPEAYRDSVLGMADGSIPSFDQDPNCLGSVKHYRSLMAMALEANKPIFKLKPGDGAIGAHVSTVRDAYQDFKKISLDILERAKISMLEI